MASAEAGLSVFRSRDFSLLWFGGLASYTGMWAMLIALPLYVFQQTGSASAAGAIATAQFAPRLFTSVAGVLVDRWNRRRTLMAANAAMMALTLPLAVPAVIGTTPSTLVVIYVSVVLVSVSSLVVGPAENALLPTLVEPRQLLTANSMNALNDNLARIIGPAVGGAVGGFVGIVGVVALNATTYAIAAVLIGLVRRSAGTILIATPVAPVRAGFVREWVGGLRLVVTSRAVVVVFVATAVVLAGDSMFFALLAPFVDQNFADAAVIFGLLMAARGAGGLLGGLLTAPLAGLLPLLHRLGGTTVVAGGLVAVLVLVRSVSVALVASALLGIAAVVWGASIQTTIQTGVPNAYLGRVFGSFGTTNAVAMTFGSAAAAALSEPLGVTAVLLIAVLLYVASGIVTYLTFPRQSGEPWPP